MFRSALILAMFLALPPLLWAGGRVIGALQQGYGWREMDWNGDGRTSAAEFLAAADTVKEPQPDGCDLYVDMKDASVRRRLCGAGRVR